VRLLQIPRLSLLLGLRARHLHCPVFRQRLVLVHRRHLLRGCFDTHFDACVDARFDPCSCFDVARIDDSDWPLALILGRLDRWIHCFGRSRCLIRCCSIDHADCFDARFATSPIGHLGD
jgi:hypothetical protein